MVCRGVYEDTSAGTEEDGKSPDRYVHRTVCVGEMEIPLVGMCMEFENPSGGMCGGNGKPSAGYAYGKQQNISQVNMPDVRFPGCTAKGVQQAIKQPRTVRVS